MVRLLLPLILLSTSAHAIGGYQTIRTSEACEAFQKNQNCTAQKTTLATNAMNGLKIQCKLSQTTICKDVKPEKTTACETTDICRDDANVGSNILDGCKSAAKEYGREALENVKKKWAAYTKCNSSLEEKQKMFASYNEVVPSILRRKALPDENLKDMSCAELDRVISGYSENIQKKMLGQLTAFETANPLLRGQLDSYPAELQDFKTWMTANSEKDFESLKSIAKGIVGLPGKAFALLDTLGINLTCYNAKARTEMVCYAALSVAEMAAETALGVGALKGVKYLTLLADASGSTKVASTVMAMRKQEAVASAASKIDPSNTRLVANAEAKYKKVQAKALEKSNALTEPGERTRVAQIMVNDGKTLTLQQAEGLQQAHDVGKSAGHGFHTYTQTEIKQKFQILTKSGFSDEQARRLIRNGIAGEFASAPATAEALQKFGARERDAAKTDAYTMIEDASKVATRGGRALGTADDALARIAIDHQIKQLEALSARSADSPGVLRQIDETKIELLRLQNTGGRELAQIDTKLLVQAKGDLEAKLKANGYNGYSKRGPDGFTAEKDLVDAIEKELASRPDVAAARDQRMAQLQSEHKAGQLQQQLNYRTASSNPAAHPFKPEITSTIQRDIEMLKGDPTRISPADFKRMQENKARANAGLHWSGGGYSGLVAEDQKLVMQFADEWNAAAARINRRRSSIEALASQQKRVITPKMVDQKTTKFGAGPTQERVASARAAGMAAEDATKITDSLKTTQNSRFSPSANAVEYRPVITSASDLEMFSNRLSAVGVTRSQLEAANALSTLDVTMLGQSTQAFNEAKALLATLQKDGNLARVTQQLSPHNATTLRNLTDTIQFYVDHDVPHHLDLGTFQ